MAGSRRISFATPSSVNALVFPGGAMLKTTLLLAVLSASGSAAASPADKGLAVLEERCARCHGPSKGSAGCASPTARGRRASTVPRCAGPRGPEPISRAIATPRCQHYAACPTLRPRRSRRCAPDRRRAPWPRAQAGFGAWGVPAPESAGCARAGSPIDGFNHEKLPRASWRSPRATAHAGPARDLLPARRPPSPQAASPSSRTAPPTRTRI